MIASRLDAVLQILREKFDEAPWDMRVRMRSRYCRSFYLAYRAGGAHNDVFKFDILIGGSGVTARSMLGRSPQDRKACGASLARAQVAFVKQRVQSAHQQRRHHQRRQPRHIRQRMIALRDAILAAKLWKNLQPDLHFRSYLVELIAIDVSDAIVEAGTPHSLPELFASILERIVEFAQMRIDFVGKAGCEYTARDLRRGMSDRIPPFVAEPADPTNNMAKRIFPGAPARRAQAPGAGRGRRARPPDVHPHWDVCRTRAARDLAQMRPA